MSLVRNERLKLLATALNNVAVAILVTALIAPSASVLYGFTSPTGSRLWPLIACGWFLGGITLHLTAQWLLKRLAP